MISNWLRGRNTTSGHDNAVLEVLEEQNRDSIARILQFRTEFSAGKSTFAEFSQLKHQFPFFGFVPCHAAGVDFVLFHANDDIVAWEYL